MSKLDGVIQLLKREEERLKRELGGITAALAAFGKTYVKGGNTRKISAAGRSRIAAAQRARWAKLKGTAGSESKVVPIRAKRKLSAAARKKIAAAQRARWARVEAGKKTA